MAAVGFHVIEVYDGSIDVSDRLSSATLYLLASPQLTAIVAALEEAKTFKGKPTFVHIRTTIGFGSQRANTGFVHGAALGDDDVKHVKKTFGFDPEKKFHVPEEVYGLYKKFPNANTF